MADENLTTEEVTEEPNGTTAEEVDYKAKYEETKRHSREWERKAKANKEAADELAKLKESQMTETEKLQKQLADATARADALQAERNRAKWVSDAAGETGIPAALLKYISADDADDMLAKARDIAQVVAAREDAPKAGVPVVIGDGSHPSEKKAPSDAKSDFAEFMKAFSR